MQSDNDRLRRLAPPKSPKRARAISDISRLSVERARISSCLGQRGDIEPGPFRTPFRAEQSAIHSEGFSGGRYCGMRFFLYLFEVGERIRYRFWVWNLFFVNMNSFHFEVIEVYTSVIRNHCAAGRCWMWAHFSNIRKKIK